MFNSIGRGIFRKFIRNVQGKRLRCKGGRGDVTTKEFRGLSSSSRVNCILRALRASLYSPSTRDAAISEHNATCFEKERMVGGRKGKEKRRGGIEKEQEFGAK